MCHFSIQWWMTTVEIRFIVTVNMPFLNRFFFFKTNYFFFTIISNSIASWVYTVYYVLIVRKLYGAYTYVSTYKRSFFSLYYHKNIALWFLIYGNDLNYFLGFLYTSVLFMFYCFLRYRHHKIWSFDKIENRTLDKEQ